MSIEGLLCKYGLVISSLRGQGYDGASNMRGEFNGLKSLIMMENESAYYIHCFAHQLQLALVSAATSHFRINDFFNSVSLLTNIVGASCKRKDMLREKSIESLLEGLLEGEVLSGRGKNQEVSLVRATTTRWGSHYRTLINLTILFDPTIEVLTAIADENVQSQRVQAESILRVIQNFEFVFCLFLMKNIFGVTNELSQALQRKDQDIVNAIGLVKVTKQLLQNMRDGGWESMWEEVASFCTKRNIIVPNLECSYIMQGRLRRKVEETTNLHLYRVEMFYNILDSQLQELNNRFNEVNTELLLCMSCLDPSNAFSAFDKGKLIRFAEFYPRDFSAFEIATLGHQLDCYIIDIRSDDQFANLSGITELLKKFFQLKKHTIYIIRYIFY